MSLTDYDAMGNADGLMLTDLLIWMIRYKNMIFTKFTANDDFIVPYLHNHNCNNNLQILYLLSFDSLIVFML